MTVIIRTNQSMLVLLGGDAAFFEMPVYELPPALLHRAATPLVEVNGCIVPALAPPVTWLEDETGTECFWTHFHLESFLAEPTPVEEVARTALDYVWSLRKGILASHLSGSFRMIAAIEMSVPARDKHSCVIRFHRMRPKQPWIAENLESYKQEAILVCDFTVPR
jgi:hypothetical protein